jgi:hypothetical protein
MYSNINQLIFNLLLTKTNSADLILSNSILLAA